MQEKIERQEYETPDLMVHGSIETITQHAGVGRKLDVGFAEGTDFGDLTFS